VVDTSGEPQGRQTDIYVIFTLGLAHMALPERTPWATMPPIVDLETTLLQAVVQGMERLRALEWYEQREKEHLGRLRKDLFKTRQE